MSEQPTTRPPLEVVIHAYSAEGFLIEIPLSLPIERLGEACKRLQAAGLQPSQASQRPAGALQSRPVTLARAQKVRPEYNSAGDPVCPEHGLVLKEGRFGLYCSGKGGEHVNDRGYCNLKFDH